MPRIAYYAHYYGSGHVRYADYVASLIPGGIPVITSREFDFRYANPVIQIPDEEFDHALREHHLITLPNYLHYSPVGVEKIRQRSLQILQAVAEHRIDMVVVDLSVEVAALLRASSVPYLYVRLFGDRRDVAHEEAFRGAMGLLAYFPEQLESDLTPNWVRKKTRYLGFKPVSPDEPSAADTSVVNLLPDTILIVRGFGEAAALETAVALIRASYPARNLVGIGAFNPATSRLLDESLGVVPDIRPYLAQAAVVVAACGSNLTAEVLRSGRPFVPVPCQRPYAEQKEIAGALIGNGLTISLAGFLDGQEPFNCVPVSCFAETYHDFFNGLVQTSDWRNYLEVELRYVPIAGHSM